MQNSRVKLKYLFVQILAELESRHGEPECPQTAFIRQLYSCHFPGPGQSLILSMANTSHSVAGKAHHSAHATCLYTHIFTSNAH